MGTRSASDFIWLIVTCGHAGVLTFLSQFSFQDSSHSNSGNIWGHFTEVLAQKRPDLGLATRVSSLLLQIEIRVILLVCQAPFYTLIYNPFVRFWEIIMTNKPGLMKVLFWGWRNFFRKLVHIIIWNVRFSIIKHPFTSTFHGRATRWWSSRAIIVRLWNLILDFFNKIRDRRNFIFKFDKVLSIFLKNLLF